MLFGKGTTVRRPVGKGGRRAALEEVVCNTVPALLNDDAVLRDLYKTDQSLYDRIRDFIAQVIDTIRQAGRSLSSRQSWAQLGSMSKDTAALEDIYRRMTEMMEGEKNGESSANTGTKYSVSDTFEADYDAWAKDRKPYVTIKVGITSKTLTGLGAKAQTVVMRSDDVIHALKHNGMTDAIIKQIPKMMENPIIIMKSLRLGDKNNHDASRVVMYGSVTDEKGAPVIAVLELRERQQGGQVLDMQLVKNAYGKDKALDEQIQKSEILYLDTDKERTNSWLHGIGLQLPPDTTNYGSIGSIAYPNGFVKMNGVRYETLLKTDGGIRNSLKDNQTETPEFKRWFGDSEVVNEDGSPKVMYHATGSEFTIFDREALGSNTADNAVDENAVKAAKTGFWFHENDLRKQMGMKKVMPAYLAIKNAYPTSLEGLMDELGETTTDEYVERIKEQGYDGLVVQDEEFGGISYVAFDPTQIKSATDNIGAFDPENPDIRYSLKETDENVQTQMSAFADVLEQTRGHRLNAAEAATLAGKIAGEFNSSYDKSKLAAELARVFDYAETAEPASMPQVDDELNDLARRVLEKSRALDQTHEEEMLPLRDYLRTTPIQLTEKQLEEAASLTGSMGLYRRAVFGRARLNQQSGTPLDTLWPELTAMNGELFPADAAEGDMPKLLLDAVQAAKAVYTNEYGMNLDETAQYL